MTRTQEAAGLERKHTKTEARVFARMVSDLEVLEIQHEKWKLANRLVPPGWHSVEITAPVAPRKKKLTVSLDADMVAWFRCLGRGYQGRMNAVLRAYMGAVIAKEIMRPGDRDWQGEVI